MCIAIKAVCGPRGNFVIRKGIQPRVEVHLMVSSAIPLLHPFPQFMSEWVLRSWGDADPSRTVGFWLAPPIQGCFPHLDLFYRGFVLGTPKSLTKSSGNAVLIQNHASYTEF